MMRFQHIGTKMAFHYPGSVPSCHNTVQIARRLSNCPFRKDIETFYYIYIDIDGKGNIVSMTIEHAKDNAGLWEFSYQEMSRKTA